MKLTDCIAGMALLFLLLCLGARSFAGVCKMSGDALEKMKVISDGFELVSGGISDRESRFLKSPRVTEVVAERKQGRNGKKCEILRFNLYGNPVLLIRGISE